MFAKFRKRSGKLLAELGVLRRKEAVLVQRAKEHIEEPYQVINTLYIEINEAQLVVDNVLVLSQFVVQTSSVDEYRNDVLA